MRVMATSVVPSNWEVFLREDENKTELFGYLALQIVSADFGTKEVFVTKGEHVLSNSSSFGSGNVSEHLSLLSPCSQEEADTRMLLHASDAAKKGHKKIMLRTADTDVVVIAVAYFSKLLVEELWLSFGVSQHFRYIAIHKIASAMGPDKSLALLFLHAFTGCDTVSFFKGCGKKTAWEVWALLPEMTAAFAALSCTPIEVTTDHELLLQKFVVALYDRKSPCANVNEARQSLFTKKGRSIDRIPPSQAALLQHAKRAAYQAGHIWGQSFVASPVVPHPSAWGWVVSDVGYRPFWSALPEASQSCKELIHCSCKAKCSKRCKCVSSGLKCTSLCACEGKCPHDIISH
jgi:hypothetical protein